MQELLMDEWLKQFRYRTHLYAPGLCVMRGCCRFLGKVMSQYISRCVAEGRGDAELLVAGFNYDRWKKTYSRAKAVRRSP